MTNRPPTRNDLIAVVLIWALVAVGVTRSPDAEVRRADVTCLHKVAVH